MEQGEVSLSLQGPHQPTFLRYLKLLPRLTRAWPPIDLGEVLVLAALNRSLIIFRAFTIKIHSVLQVRIACAAFLTVS